jgi:dynein heavy chain
MISKKISRNWGEKNKSGSFIFADNEIIEPSFIEDVNNLLSTGEVPNLWDKDTKA